MMTHDEKEIRRVKTGTDHVLVFRENGKCGLPPVSPKPIQSTSFVTVSLYYQ